MLLKSRLVKKFHTSLDSFVGTLGMCSLGLFLFINIFAVQQVTPIYADVSSGEITSLIRFFEKAKALNEFYEIFPEVQQTFGLYEENVYAGDRRRQEMIQELQAILVQNPQSRDALYALSVIYAKENEKELSMEYLQRARAIDPNIGK